MEVSRTVITSNPHWHRTRISQELCRVWDWKNEAGRAKDIAARALLRSQFPLIRRLSQEAASEEDRANAAGWFHSDLLFERFVAAAPPLAAEILEAWNYFSDDEEDFSVRDAVKAGFEMQFVRNFAERMGLVEIHIGENYFNDVYLRPTPLFSIVFE
jgi:hypothetical protein